MNILLKKLNINATKIEILLYILSRVWLAIFTFFVLFFSIPESSFSFKNYQLKIIGRNLVPEGWAFFTRDAREDDFEFYEIKNGRILKNKYFPFSSLQNLYGIKRTPKVINSELFIILNQLDSISWQPCKLNILKGTMKLDRNYISVQNPLKNSLINDSVCVIHYDPIPWAWADLIDKNENTVNYILLVVK